MVDRRYRVHGVESGCPVPAERQMANVFGAGYVGHRGNRHDSAFFCERLVGLRTWPPYVDPLLAIPRRQRGQFRHLVGGM